MEPNCMKNTAKTLEVKQAIFFTRAASYNSLLALTSESLLNIQES